MLNRREKKLLEKELAEVKKINQRAAGVMLPEEKAVWDKEYPSGGIHRHDDDNPFGMHRHLIGDSIDGAHTHTPQNPEGEHVHGPLEGKALITGAHTHENMGSGYHWHDDGEDGGGPIPLNAPKVV